MGGNLEWLAQDMKRSAIRGGYARRELARGLALELATEIDRPAEKPIGELMLAEFKAPAPVWWVLSLSRPATEPSEKEIEIIRGAFEVPSDADLERRPFLVILRWPMN